MQDGTLAFLPFLVVAVFMGVCAGIYFYFSRVEQKRFEEFARSRGWSYSRSERPLARQFPQVFPFGKGRARNCRNVLGYAAGDHSGYSFEYSYKERSVAGRSRSSTTYRFHVVSLVLPAHLPRLALRPENAFDGLTKFFGKQDIQFESEEFNRAWLVQSDHLPSAHDVIDPRMMRWLMRPEHAQMSFVCEGDVLFTFIPGKQRAENIDTIIAILTGFHDRVPGFVWQKAAHEYPPPLSGSRYFGLFG